MGGFGAVGGFLAAAGLPMAALIGGLLTAAVIYGLAWRRGVHGFRLVLVGIGLQAMLLAIVGGSLLVLSRILLQTALGPNAPFIMAWPGILFAAFLGGFGLARVTDGFLDVALAEAKDDGSVRFTNAMSKPVP